VKRGRTVSDIRGYIDAGSMNDMAGGKSSARPGATAVSVPYVSAREIAFSGKPDSARNLFGGQRRFSRSRGSAIPAVPAVYSRSVYFSGKCGQG